MLQFTRLRLFGFKSFVDSTDVPVEPGLTGIVGPNGCGKSNLVEALRWVMGETSAKQMRGGEMDDVIFGGTSQRPARSLAEVGVLLDNTARVAPAQFNGEDELEVVRRIERGSGSAYKVNGREVRARDVQLLFADAGIGARSSAIVSQGRIGAIIAAKPAERRMLLENAAGIAGLHARRREAEQRLRAAESNLERLEDVLATLEEQFQGLKRQARQASRYRSISERIRAAEELVLHRQWLEALEALEAARGRSQASEAQVQELTGAASAAATAQTEAAAVLPALRQAEAEAAAKLQRLHVAREQLAAEEERAGQARQDLERRLRQADSDAAREAERRQDAVAALDRLREERGELEAAQAGEEEAQAEARARLEELEETAAALEAELGDLTASIAAAETERQQLTRRVAEAESRARRLSERAAEVAEQRRRAEADAVPEEEVAEAEARVEAARERAEAAHADTAAAEEGRHRAQAARDAARDAVQREAAARARLRAEESALAELLAEANDGEHAPVLDAVKAAPGYEVALAAALGDDLSAPLAVAEEAEQPAVHWRTLPPLPAPPPLPAGTRPLADVVEAPPALARRLAQVAVIEDAERGAAMRHDLAPGQRLVTPDGDVWRWDGFTVTAGAPSAAATRLRQRNRLEALREEIAAAEAAVAAAEEGLAAAEEAVARAAEAESAAREAARAAEHKVSVARDAHALLAQRAAAAASRLATLAETAEGLEADRAQAEAELVEAREALAALDDDAQARARLADLRAALAERRAAAVEARSALDRLLREAEQRRARLQAIARDSASWEQRIADADRHRAELAERRQALVEELERLTARPLEIEEQRQALLDQIQAAEAARGQAADRLAQAEAKVEETARALREAEQALAAAREERARHQAGVEAADQSCRATARRIADRLGVTPETLATKVEEADDGAPLEALEQKLERLYRERDNIGPVNLRAEEEMREVEERLEGLRAERQDLLSAVAKLRGAIGALNREGRERLLASFEAVDEHFRELFVRLFGGGRAHLDLVESDDPLEAGLEIMASPPGKRLQTLSLLSGGEQALTALSLLFAVFMTNPAPICVLDEVDAPLDDANVDRFCRLVEEIAQAARTRFLIVTHHRMTMARMDRLFGVTMAERGVSQLVAVDLRQAEQLREPA